MTPRTIAAGVGLAASLFLVAGCGAAVDKVAEKATEKAIENESGGKVDIDTDSGKVKVKTDKGTYESDGNGNVKISGEDGNTNFTAGDGTKLPEDWPDELAPPDGTKLISASTSESGGKQVMTVMGEIDAPVKDVYDGLKDQLEGAGFEFSADSFGTAGGGSYGALAGKSDQWEVNASITSSGSDGKTTVSMSLTPVG